MELRQTCLNCQGHIVPTQGRFCSELCEEEFHSAKVEHSETVDELGQLYGIIQD